MGKECSLLINSCDDYNDVLCSQLRLLDYFKYLSKYFNSVYVNTESITFADGFDDRGRIVFLQNESAYWGERLISSLQKINSEFVFVLFDDYFPIDNFSAQLFDGAIDFLSKNDGDCLLLSPVLKCLDDENKNENFSFVPKDHLYRINSAPAIWRTTSLLKTLNRSDDPWVWECFSMYRRRSKDLSIFSVHKGSRLRYRYSYCTGGAVYRGSWVEPAFSYYNDEIRSLIKFGERRIVNSIEVNSRTLKWKLSLLFKGVSSSGLSAMGFFTSSLIRSVKKRFFE